MHRDKVGGVPGVDWEQLGGKRFEQFKSSLQRTESVNEGRVVWCQFYLLFENSFNIQF